jgi:hypothetical protein
MEPRGSSSSHVAKLSWSLISKWDQALIRVENKLRGQFWKNRGTLLATRNSALLGGHILEKRNDHYTYAHAHLLFWRRH